MYEPTVNSDTRKSKMGEVLAPREYRPMWANILSLTYFHLAAIYGFDVLFQAKIYTFLWGE